MDQAIQFVAPLVLPIAASAASFYGVLTGVQVKIVPLYGLASCQELPPAGKIETQLQACNPGMGQHRQWAASHMCGLAVESGIASRPAVLSDISRTLYVAQ